MLGLLQSDLSRQGVQTSSKGNCSACQKPVVGQVTDQDDAPLSLSLALLITLVFELPLLCENHHLLCSARCLLYSHF